MSATTVPVPKSGDGGVTTAAPASPKALNTIAKVARLTNTVGLNERADKISVAVLPL